jgi:hypothetical protein
MEIFSINIRRKKKCCVQDGIITKIQIYTNVQCDGIQYVYCVVPCVLCSTACIVYCKVLSTPKDSSVCIEIISGSILDPLRLFRVPYCRQIWACSNQTHNHMWILGDGTNCGIVGGGSWNNISLKSCTSKFIYINRFFKT